MKFKRLIIDYVVTIWYFPCFGLTHTLSHHFAIDYSSFQYPNLRTFNSKVLYRQMTKDMHILMTYVVESMLLIFFYHIPQIKMLQFTSFHIVHHLRCPRLSHVRVSLSTPTPYSSWFGFDTTCNTLIVD